MSKITAKHTRRSTSDLRYTMKITKGSMISPLRLENMTIFSRYSWLVWPVLNILLSRFMVMIFTNQNPVSPPQDDQENHELRGILPKFQCIYHPAAW